MLFARRRCIVRRFQSSISALSYPSRGDFSRIEQAESILREGAAALTIGESPIELILPLLALTALPLLDPNSSGQLSYCVAEAARLAGMIGAVDIVATFVDVATPAPHWVNTGSDLETAPTANPVLKL